MILPTLLLLSATLACNDEPAAAARSQDVQAATAAAPDPLLQHHEILADQMPAPYATSSSGNPPRVIQQPSGATLHLPSGFQISLFASGLVDPRTMVLSPNGDVFLAEPGGGRITVFRLNADSTVAKRFTFAAGLNEPFGLAFHDNYLYVGNTDAVVRFAYTPGQTSSSGEPQTITSLPPGGHSTRGVLFNAAGTKMYVSVGSEGNVEVDNDPLRAAITEFNPDGSGKRTFASGLRNPVGMAWEPVTGTLWTVVNERDGLGDDLVPDYATRVDDGAFYGWPYSYIGQHLDPRISGRQDLVARTVVPSLLIASHSAPLGIAFYTGDQFPAEYRGRAFVALHGSWNRSRRTGYKIISIPMQNGQPTGGYDDFVVGWMTDEESVDVWGRPVSLLVLPDGSLLISDDGAEKIWRVTYAAPPPRRRAAEH